MVADHIDNGLRNTREICLGEALREHGAFLNFHDQAGRREATAFADREAKRIEVLFERDGGIMPYRAKVAGRETHTAANQPRASGQVTNVPEQERLHIMLLSEKV